MAPRLDLDEPTPPGRSGRGFSVAPEDRVYRRSGFEEEAPARRGLGRAIVAALVAVACAGGLWFVYERGHHPGGSVGGIPLIHADAGATKVLPKNPGGEAAPEDDRAVYQMGQNGGTEVEHLLPPPEQPMARPEAPLPVQEVGEAPVPQAAPATPEPPAGSAASPATSTAPAMLSAPPGTKSAPGVVVPPPVVLHPATPVPAAPPPAPKPAAAAPNAMAQLIASAESSGSTANNSGIFRVQIAATKDDASAQHEWARLQQAHPDLLGGLSPTLVKADLGDRGVFYRIQAGPVTGKEAADKLCGQLKALSIGCIVVKP